MPDDQTTILYTAPGMTVRVAAPGDAGPADAAELLYAARLTAPDDGNRPAPAPDMPTDAASQAARLYPNPRGLTSQLTTRDRDLFDQVGMLEPDRRALRTFYTDLHARGVPEVVLMTLHDADVNDRLAAARPQEIDGEAARAALRTAWATESRRTLVATYGADAEDILTRVQAFVASVGGEHFVDTIERVGDVPGLLADLAHHVAHTGWRPE